MRNISMAMVAGLAFVAAFAGCVPEAEHPIGNPDTAQQDAQLHGLWVADQSDGETQYLHIGAEPEKGLAAGVASPEAGLMRFWLIGHTTESGRVDNPFGMRFFVSRVGDSQYASLALPIDDRETAPPRSWWFFKYQVDQGKLTTWGMDFETVGKFIEDGKVRGTVERDSQGRLKKVLITASSEQVEDFVEENDDALFPDNLKTIFHKVATVR
jgi:hypothetical protein